MIFFFFIISIENVCLLFRFGGRKIRLPGRKIRIRVRVNFKVPLLKHWDWRRYVRGYKYECKYIIYINIVLFIFIYHDLFFVQLYLCCMD